MRSTLLLLGPFVALTVGAYVYYTSGRVVETDNAYVKADVAIVSAEIAGPIAAVGVRENQRVKAGDVLFTIDDRPFNVALARADAQLAAIDDFVESTRASYAQALEQLALARTNAAYEQRELDRLTALAERKLASEFDVDEARHEQRRREPGKFRWPSARSTRSARAWAATSIGPSPSRRRISPRSRRATRPRSISSTRSCERRSTASRAKCRRSANTCSPARPS